MKTITVLFALFLFFPLQIQAQRNSNKNPSEIRKPRLKIKSVGGRKQVNPKPIIQNTSLKRVKELPRNSIAQHKIKVERDSEQKHEIPKKKKIYPIMIEDHIQLEFKEIDKGYCRAGKIFRKYEYLIMEEPYPYFPLRFVEASITYLFTEEETDYYDLKIKIEAKYASYFEQFGIIVDFGCVDEKLFKFNEQEEFLEEDFMYLFKQNIALDYIGYKNLRIGYFDPENKLFYPENFIPKKTDILLFVEKDKEKRIRKNNTRIITNF